MIEMWQWLSDKKAGRFGHRNPDSLIGTQALKPQAMWDGTCANPKGSITCEREAARKRLRISNCLPGDNFDLPQGTEQAVLCNPVIVLVKESLHRPIFSREGYVLLPDNVFPIHSAEVRRKPAVWLQHFCFSYVLIQSMGGQLPRPPATLRGNSISPAPAPQLSLKKA